MNDDQIEVLAALQAALHRHPNLRVCQLIVNALGEDPYYLTDAEAARLIRKYVSL